MPPAFIPLKVRTPYSLAEGALRIPELLKLCQQQQLPAVGVCDHGNLFGALEFSLSAAKAGIQPIIGVTLYVTLGTETLHQLHLYAQNSIGYHHLLKLVSLGYEQAGVAERPFVPFSALHGNTEGLLAITGGHNSTMAWVLKQQQPALLTSHMADYQQLFDNRLYIEIARHGLPQEQAIETALLDVAYTYNIPLLATRDVFFGDAEMQQAHDVLLCIAQGTTLSDDKRLHSQPTYAFPSSSEMAALYADIPEALLNTVHFAQRCAFMVETRDPILPKFGDGTGKPEQVLLQEQADHGLAKRLADHVPEAATNPDIASRYQQRLAYELDVISGMGFPGYFLIVADFIQWAKARGIPVGPGRGSGAGSVVAWALQITDLDPIRLDLLFERFLNPERVSMPDFDIDFCQDRRDEVIAYVQQKYGSDRVAQIITFGKLQARAALRDVGRVLELPYPLVDKICKLVPNNPANPVTLSQAVTDEPQLQAYSREEETGTLIAISLQLEGLYRHASTHAAGVVIGDRPLNELVPLYRDPRGGMPATQFNMKYVEQAGLVKFDFLGLKTLTVMQMACALIYEQTGKTIDLLRLPERDNATYTMLSQGESTGVFQLESSGMRDVLRKLKPDRFEDIIALVALYRPGPMDNIPRYIACKHGDEQPDYLHEKLEPILKETFGVMIYQEQVMQAAQLLAGYSLGAADLLRRAMGKKIKAEMDAQRQIFTEGAIKQGVAADTAGYVFDQVAKFAGYGFNKSHAAAYALVAYQTAWLKANHACAFFAATMTYDMANTDKLVAFAQELTRLQIPLLPPDINTSSARFGVESTTNGDAVRYALAAIKGVGENISSAIAAERQSNGAFTSLFDFVKRLADKGINKRVLECLCAAGAFDSLHPSRAAVAANIETALDYAHAIRSGANSEQASLFGEDDCPLASIPVFTEHPEWPALEKLAQEQSAVGFYLSAHPLDGYAGVLEKLGATSSCSIMETLQQRNHTRVTLAGIVISKKERKSAKGNRYAFVQFSDKRGVYECTLFSDVLAAARDILDSGAPLLIQADATIEGDSVRLVAQRITLLLEAAGRASKGMQIVIENAAALQPLKQLLAQDGTGTARLELHLMLDSTTQVKLRLPRRYALGAHTRTELTRLAGVAQVIEIAA